MTEYEIELRAISDSIAEFLARFKDIAPEGLRISLDLTASEIESELPVD